MEIRRHYRFGKVAWCGKRKSNLIELEVCLTTRNGYPEFTASGNVCSHIHTDIVAGGQCLDDIIERFPRFKNSTLYSTIFDLWQKYHLKNVSNIPAEDSRKIELLVSDKTDEEVRAELKALKA
jgi:hypothetical protein